ncbi:hypothetical protein CCACVL1_06320 [Corchorus capsularis]|uniref:Bromo domain-containing protein n=1 Tax=Corchorus capsularis TaxID=210143 RepID=A0A1R3JGA4_COCAP|nr:hypothetical protein CCACVL1_06320 [Corchorus capsularis]
MASGTAVEEGKDAPREKQRYTESKVYTRKAFKGPKKNNLLNTTATNTNANSSDNKNNNENVNTNNTASNNTTVTPTAGAAANDEGNASEKNNDDTTNKNTATNQNHKDAASAVAPEQPLPLEDENSARPLEDGNSAQPLEDGNSALQHSDPLVDTALSDDTLRLNKQQVVAGNGALNPNSENPVKINLASRSKQEMRELRQKLESELDLVRTLVKKIEAKEGQIRGFNNSRFPLNNTVDYGLTRVQSEVASVGIPHEPVRQSRPLNQLSISVLENSQGNENLEKEKRTPKANQFYRNSEFLLAKDKFPPAESNKKSKANGKKQGGEFTHGFGSGNKFFKSCSSLLERLMKHKHGWVFNAPVDVKGLGLHDYYSIIKHPMDLGSVKSRLNKNWYKSPREFAEDVRLTFRNAMTYNPKGQDVHVMAEQLSKIFEDKWAVIEADYIREMRLAIEYEVNLPTPMARKAHPMLPPPLDMRRILDRSESMIRPFEPIPQVIATTPSGRTPAPRKPKAKDPYKRDMTYEEKQKLSTNLQSLPSEKLDNIVQIIKKRNSSLFQHDDEIEVDIDSVDTETLWELDRFVTNYKKSLSKNKRKAELAIQARAEAEQIVPEKATAAPVLVEVPKEATTNKQKVSASPPVEVEKQGHNASRSSSSSSSSSDSGSSSSDSDSESSSASGSDAGHSPRYSYGGDNNCVVSIGLRVTPCRIWCIVVNFLELRKGSSHLATAEWSWRESPLNEERFWGPNGAQPPLKDTETPLEVEVEACGSSLAELGALVLSTPDPLTKSKLSHLAFSRWRNQNLPIGICHPPPRPARPPTPLLVSPKEIPAPNKSGLPLNAFMLHNLAHVELNAIDLAWDTVVRFSPLSDVLGEQFFSDFAHVADDESRHFAWCSQRLAEIGFNYGDMPAHNLLWRECEKSSDSVAGRLAAIPLVQEARGLDAGPRLVQKMVGFGDHRTSHIVARIAEEEIAHVAVGVYWFISVCRQMNRAPCSTFKELLKEYDLELKGPFNHSAREEAGIPREWYDSSSMSIQDTDENQNKSQQLSEVYDRLACIVSMESENSNLIRPSQ